jgi:hypothetical protein
MSHDEFLFIPFPWWIITLSTAKNKRWWLKLFGMKSQLWMNERPDNEPQVTVVWNERTGTMGERKTTKTRSRIVRAMLVHCRERRFIPMSAIDSWIHNRFNRFLGHRKTCWFLKVCLYSGWMWSPYIDYRLKIDFWCPRVVWQFKNPIRFPAVKQGVNPGIRSWVSTYLIELDVRIPLVVSISRSEELRLYNLV